jgi:hypothetical protein
MISFEDFAATEFSKMFSDRQPGQGVKVHQCFRERDSPWNFGEISRIHEAVYLRRFIELL